MKTCKLIVHADDFGLTHSVNKGIIDAHQNGILTSTSIMANGPAFDEAIELALAVPTLDIGVHLTLVEESPLVSPSQITSIVNSSGKLLNNAKEVYLRYLKKRLDMEHVRAEFEAQIVKIKSTGLPISHIDGHQHLHILPNIFLVVVELAKKHNIQAIRIPKENIRRYMFRNITNIKRVMELAVLNIYASISSTELNHPDAFVGFYYGGNINYRNLESVITHLPKDGTCELMCHPGASSDDAKYSHWQYSWADELNALKSIGIREQLDRQGVSLISYRDLNVNL